MRARLLAIVTAFLCVASVAWGADRPDVKGLYLLADYPAVSVQPGTTANIPIKLQNYGVAPERLELSVTGVPSGWTATLLGGGQPDRGRDAGDRRRREPGAASRRSRPMPAPTRRP